MRALGHNLNADEITVLVKKVDDDNSGHES
jgi:hypothetical protein